VEVFLIPDGDTEKFLLLDTVELQDKTLKKLSEIFLKTQLEIFLIKL